MRTPWRAALLAVLLVCLSTPGSAALDLRLTVAGSEVAGTRASLLPLLPNYEAGLARLGLAAVEPLSVATTTIADDGRGVLEVPARGCWTVRLEAEGRVPMEYRRLVVVEDLELPPVRLEPAIDLRVRVVDRATPVEGSWVIVQPPRGRQRNVGGKGWAHAFRAATTDRDGIAQLPRAAARAEEISVFADGYPEAVAIASDGELVVEVARATTRSIVVLDAGGRAASGVLVRTGDLAWPVALTDAAGEVEVPAGPDEPSHVLLTTPAGRQEWFELEPRAASKVAVLSLPLHVLLTGRVRRPSGEPIAGALVWNSVDPGALVRSDEDGRYRMPAPTVRRFRVQAEKARHYPHAALVNEAWTRVGRGPSLELAPASGLRGKVMTHEGFPVTGAEVEAVPARRRSVIGADPADGRAWSAASGDFEITGLEPRAPYRVRVTRGGFVPHEQGLVTAAEGAGWTSLRLTLAPARPLVGRVVGDRGRPIAGARVLARPPGELPSWRDLGRSEQVMELAGRLLARTDDRGTFFLPEAPAPIFDLAVWGEGYAPAIIGGVTLPAGGGRYDLGDVALAHAEVVTGTVRRPDGRPIAGAALYPLAGVLAPSPTDRHRLLRGEPAALSAADGTFAVGGLARRDALSLYVEAPGHVGRWLGGLVTPVRGPLDVILEAGAVLAGRVVDESGRGLVARVEVERFDKLAGSDERVAPLDAEAVFCHRNGRFELADLAPGEVRIRAQAVGYVVSEARVVELPLPADEPELELVLARGAQVEGRVTAEDRRAVPEARVTLAGAAGTTDGDGLVELSGVPPGVGFVEVRHPHYGRATLELTVESVHTSFEIEMPAAHTVSGRVSDSGGRAVEGAWVRLREASGEPWRDYRAVSAPDGAFELPRVIDGEYRLIAGGAGYAETGHPTIIRVAGGSPAAVEVSLADGHTLFGRVTGLEPDLLPRVALRLEGPGGRQRTARPDSGGRYRVADLSTGSWLLIGSLAGGRREARERVELATEAEVERDLHFRRGLSLAGRVLFDGTPLPETRITLSDTDRVVDRQAVTDPQGEFHIESLERGSYRLGVSNPRERLTNHRAVELTSDVWLEVVLGVGEAGGQVVASDTLEPIGGALVRLRRVRDAFGAEELLVARPTDDSGYFHMARVPEGRYRVLVSREHYGLLERELLLTAGQRVAGLYYELAPTAGLRARVRLADGQLPGSVALRLTDPAGRVVLESSCPVDTAGSVHFATAPSGRWQLAMQAPGSTMHQEPVEVPAAPIDLVLSLGGNLDVWVRDLTESNALARLRILDSAQGPFTSLSPTGELETEWPVVGGRASVDGVPAGGWTVLVEAPDGRRWQREVVSTGVDVVLVILD